MLNRTRLARRRILKPVILCSHFVTMQLALLAGFLRFCSGNLTGHWTRTPRQDLPADG